ncbi:hypothetical protein LUR56_05565 [Streptomyces sp. MT29]|nr:hypothetical protein [Streptomyces sp. MT29]
MMWLVSVWAVRGAKVAGRSPFAAALGLVQAMGQHPAGRIRDGLPATGAPQFLMGSFVIEQAPAPEEAVAVAAAAPADVVRQAGPASGLAQLLGGSGFGTVPVRGL